MTDAASPAPRSRWTPARRDLLDGLARELLHNYGHGRTLVAVDRAPGADSRRFADDLATALRTAGHDAFRASMDAFQRPRAEREARRTAQGRYDDTYDYSVLRRVLIEPFRLAGGAGFVTAAWDARRDMAIEPDWLTGPVDAMLVVDGEFLLRPELRGVWNTSIRVEAEGADAPADPLEAGAWRLYEKVTPRDAAVVIVDDGDPAAPRRIFIDAC